MNRERITITLEGSLLPAIDRLIDGRSVRNRSHAIEVAVRRGLALQELSSLYFIYHRNYDSALALPTLNLLEPANWYIIAPSTELGNAQLWLQSLSEQVKIKPLSTTAVSADFGSAGALLLHQDKWREQILIIDMQPNAASPKDFLSGYTTHTQQHQPVTSFVQGDGHTYTSTGWHLANSSLAKEIGAGYSSLEETIFPQLAKAGKVNTYVSQT